MGSSDGACGHDAPLAAEGGRAYRTARMPDSPRQFDFPSRIGPPLLAALDGLERALALCGAAGEPHDAVASRVFVQPTRWRALPRT